jgi:hypothetical protein
MLDETTRRQFRTPPAAFRGVPFWSWNDDLDEARLMRQIGWLAEMGFGGFHIHVRTGLRLEYLGAAFLARVRACVEEAADRDLLAWLYDEDRWPSGCRNPTRCPWIGRAGAGMTTPGSHARKCAASRMRSAAGTACHPVGMKNSCSCSCS